LKKVSFYARIQKEGINPYVDPPLRTGAKLGGEKAVIPVKVWLDSHPFRANLMPLGPKRTQAAPGIHHRLYLHGIMRKTIGKDVGYRVGVVLQLDLKPPVVPMNTGLAKELKKDSRAKRVFESLSLSHQKELKRYLNHLKSPEALQRNIDKVMGYLRKSQATWFGKKKPIR
jgi:hypothetical protein